MSGPHPTADAETRLAAVVPAGGAPDAAFAAVGDAERRGIDLVWLDGGDDDVAAWLLAAAVAAHTSAVRLGVITSLPLQRSWLRLAEDAASLDGIAAGRLELALRTGRSGLAEGVELAGRLRAVWRGEAVEIEDAAEVEVHPRPAERGGPPLWIACEAALPEDARSAARADLGWLARTEADARALVETAGERAGPARLALDALHFAPREGEAPSDAGWRAHGEALRAHFFGDEPGAVVDLWIPRGGAP